jgi:hypothetical protein
MAHYLVFLPDLSFFQKTIARQFACAALAGGRAYVKAIVKGSLSVLA